MDHTKLFIEGRFKKETEELHVRTQLKIAVGLWTGHFPVRDHQTIRLDIIQPKYFIYYPSKSVYRLLEGTGPFIWN